MRRRRLRRRLRLPRLARRLGRGKRRRRRRGTSRRMRYLDTRSKDRGNVSSPRSGRNTKGSRRKSRHMVGRYVAIVRRDRTPHRPPTVGRRGEFRVPPNPGLSPLPRSSRRRPPSSSALSGIGRRFLGLRPAIRPPPQGACPPDGHAPSFPGSIPGAICELRLDGTAAITHRWPHREGVFSRHNTPSRLSSRHPLPGRPTTPRRRRRDGVRIRRRSRRPATEGGAPETATAAPPRGRGRRTTLHGSVPVAIRPPRRRLRSPLRGCARRRRRARSRRCRRR